MKPTGLDRHMQACKETMNDLSAIYDRREESDELWPLMLRLAERLQLQARMLKNEIDTVMAFTDIMNLYPDADERREQP